MVSPNNDKRIFELASQIVSLQKEVIEKTLAIYSVEIPEIIEEKSTDRSRIEHALDQLLDLAFDGHVLKLFKQLCRYYYSLDPLAAVQYVNFYREQWDPESFEADSNNKEMNSE